MKPYRRNASAVVLRLSEENHQVLLLKKPRMEDAWQLPQGGIEDGETVEQAAMRELNEETGIENSTLLGRLKQTYQYEYPKGFSRFPDYRGQLIVFVAVTVPPSTEAAVDGMEVVEHRWLSPIELASYLQRPDYLHVVQKALQEAINMIPASSRP